MAAVLGAFVQYVVTGVGLTALAVLGVFAGKKLREKKQAQTNTGGEK